MRRFYYVFRRSFYILFAMSALVLVGCAGSAKTGVSNLHAYIVPDKVYRKDIDTVRKRITRLNEINDYQKNDPEWLKEAYSGLKIKKLSDLKKEEYKTYGKFSVMDKKRLYIIVHPGFGAFFNGGILTTEKDRNSIPKENIVERFYLKSSSLIGRASVIQEQEMLLRDFLEAASFEKKLVLLVLPKDYAKYVTYGHVGRDEYARFINEVTNMSESVLYMDSLEWNYGAVGEKEKEMLSDFISANSIENVYVGGGFLCECLDTFVSSVAGRVGYEKLKAVPELTVVSPADLAGNPELVDKNGLLDFREVESLILSPCSTGSMAGVEFITPLIRHFYVYESDTKKSKPASTTQKPAEKKDL